MFDWRVLRKLWSSQCEKDETYRVIQVRVLLSEERKNHQRYAAGRLQRCHTWRNRGKVSIMWLKESSEVAINANGNNRSRSDRSIDQLPLTIMPDECNYIIVVPVVTASRLYSSQIIPSPSALISGIKTFVTASACWRLGKNDPSVHTLHLVFFVFFLFFF